MHSSSKERCVCRVVRLIMCLVGAGEQCKDIDEKLTLNLPLEAAVEFLQLTYMWHFNLSTKTSERDF